MKVIVSRHPAAVRFIARALGRDLPELANWPSEKSFTIITNDGEAVMITADAKPEDVAGKDVYGNVPLKLAALARSVFALEFEGEAPRGVEYTLDDMVNAGARLTKYKVFDSEHMAAANEFLLNCSPGAPAVEQL